MALHYNCKHCGTNIGSLNQVSLHTEQLGFHKLTEEERQEMIQYHPNGDIHVQTICEDCQEALERNPELHHSDFLIQ
ncbi:anti-sigma-F factor Fin [Bacillus carboniphilus]|uniref:Anti-sigma-F factor Fin n=1 Tax=Bacillus carboniphilus TaxID=86663 RepID=A0ABN0VYV2_9BACI